MMTRGGSHCDSYYSNGFLLLLLTSNTINSNTSTTRSSHKRLAHFRPVSLRQIIGLCEFERIGLIRFRLALRPNGPNHEFSHTLTTHIINDPKHQHHHLERLFQYLHHIDTPAGLRFGSSSPSDTKRAGKQKL